MTAGGYSGKVIGSMRYTRITSASNRHIRDAIEIRTKRTGERPRSFLIEGPHLVETAVEAGADIRKVFVSGAFIARKENSALLRRVAKCGGEFFEVTGQLLGKITDTETPQGIAAVVAHRPLELGGLRAGSRTFVVVIDGIQDPGNLGTIVRTADAAGADAVVLLPGTCDVFMPKTVRATAGSIFHLPVVHAGLVDLCAWLHEREIPLAATSADAERDLYRVDLSGSVAVAFGNEAHGVSSELRRSSDLCMRIPIFGRAESLNVATAAAICLYEAARQRSESGVR